MNKLFELFTDEAKAKFTGIFATKEFASFIEKTKAASDSGTFRVIISTADPDRQGDSVDQNLWDLSNYLNNPVVLWAHDYNSLPIGMATNVEKQTVAGANVLVAEGKFAPMEANPFAQQVRALYDAGIVKATSVGYIPNAMRMDGKSAQGNELLEFSFVPVPANPQALSLAQVKKLGLNLELLKKKGIVIERKDDDPQEGDTCALDDGSEGILQLDGNGDLQCMPNPKSAGTKDTDGEKQQKSGRTLSGETREKIQKTIEVIKAVTAALEELLTTADSQGDEGKDEPDDAVSPKQRSNTPGSPAVPDFKDWQFSREVLRAIVTSGSDALERFNKIARAKTRQK